MEPFSAPWAVAELIERAAKAAKVPVPLESADGLDLICKSCKSAERRHRYANNPTFRTGVRASNRRYLKRNYDKVLAGQRKCSRRADIKAPRSFPFRTGLYGRIELVLRASLAAQALLRHRDAATKNSLVRGFRLRQWRHNSRSLIRAGIMGADRVRPLSYKGRFLPRRKRGSARRVFGWFQLMCWAVK